MNMKMLLNKNRGWRGLAEAIITNNNTTLYDNIFSFSSKTWYDLIMNKVFVFETEEQYYVLYLEVASGKLPTPSQQRSVLIKDVVLNVIDHRVYNKSTYVTEAKGLDCTDDIIHINRYVLNNNRHTTSMYNCVGIRVRPSLDF